MGALGAALFARDHILSSRKPGRAGTYGGALDEPAPPASTSAPPTRRPSCSTATADRRPRDDARPASSWPRRRAAAYDAALADAGATESRRRATSISTGYGRFQVAFRDAHVTDLTAAARGARLPLPEHPHDPRRRRPDDEGDPRRRAGRRCGRSG